MTSVDNLLEDLVLQLQLRHELKMLQSQQAKREREKEKEIQGIKKMITGIEY